MTYYIVHKLNFNFPCPPPFLLQCYMAHGRLAANKSKLEKVQNAQFRESEYLICLCLFCETIDCFFGFFGWAKICCVCTAIEGNPVLHMHSIDFSRRYGKFMMNIQRKSIWKIFFAFRCNIQSVGGRFNII